MNKLLIILLFASLNGYGQYALPYHFSNSGGSNPEELACVISLGCTFTTNQIYITSDHFQTLTAKQRNQQTLTIYGTGIITSVGIYYLVKYIRNNNKNRKKWQLTIN